MKGRIFIILTALCCAAHLISCSQKHETKKENVMEGSFFEGGYGLEWLIDAGKKLEQIHPGVKANIWGNPRNWDQIRPRVIAGNPPDAVWGLFNINLWDLLAEGRVHNLDSLMNMPAYGQEKVKFKDSFMPGVLEQGQYDGHQYFLPLNYTILGIWYNVNMFEKHGWQVPKTWNEFLSLCEKIKATGVAPLTYQGRYPSYYLMIIRGLLYRIGGKQLIVDMDNLVPGAWKRPEVIRAAKMGMEVFDKGYVEKGATAFTHTEAQMEWLQGKAAMVPCGTWLEHEMKPSIPPGFRMKIMPIPIVEGGKGDPTGIEASAVPTFWVPAQAKRPDLGMEYLRILLSLETSRKFAENQRDVMALKNATEGAKISPALQSAVDLIKKARETFDMRYTDWYKDMDENGNMGNLVSAMINKEITPEQFGEKAEALAEKVRTNPKVIKHKRSLSEQPVPVAMTGQK